LTFDWLAIIEPLNSALVPNIVLPYGYRHPLYHRDVELLVRRRHYQQIPNSHLVDKPEKMATRSTCLPAAFFGRKVALMHDLAKL
jgi:hypothetical protein